MTKDSYDTDNRSNQPYTLGRCNMPYTISRSFDVYRSEFVDLDSEQVKKARRSRDYLVSQIKAVAAADSTFPKLYGGTDYKPFGSFARSTKVRPLDDIDLLLLLSGKGTTSSYQQGNTCWLRVNEQTEYLKPYMDSYGYLNSTKILNKFKSSLTSVSNYRNAYIKRTGVAVTLSLSSYDWVFDVVPAFPVSDGQGGVSYYLIPDGSGEWMRTDPRKDQDLVTEVNQTHNQLLLPLIRLIKYWNTHRHSPPTLTSYYLETMLITGLRYHSVIPSLRSGIETAFRVLQSSVLGSCPDPKGLGSNLDAGVSWETKNKVSDAAKQMADSASWALYYEGKDDHKSAIKYWSAIFPNFPAYG